MSAFVEIVHPNGARERHPVNGDRAVLGRQPREGISIPYAQELELEHLLFIPRKDGCWISVVEGARTPVLIQGNPFASGMVAWGTEANLGPIWFKVLDEAPAQVPAKSPLSAGKLVLVAALLAFAAWLFLSTDESELPQMTSAKPPVLFAVVKSCPEQDPALAEPRAREAADAALAKSQRYPFAAQDGISAVDLYALAARCFAAAGRDSAAQEMERDRGLMERRILEDYRTLRLKLEQAIQYRRTRQALAETQRLLELLKHLDHPYTTWLRNMKRRLLIKTDSKS